MIITSTEQAKEGELVQLRKVAALVKGVAEKAEKGTQSVPMGKKEEIQEEVDIGDANDQVREQIDHELFVDRLDAALQVVCAELFKLNVQVNEYAGVGDQY